MGRFTRREGVLAVLGAAGLGVASVLLTGKPGGPAAGPRAGAQDGDLRPASAITPLRPPAALPPLVFRMLDGSAVPLAAYAGQPIVLNFWATWCAPCVAELPELDRLAASGGFAVLVVSADRGGAGVVRPFVAAHGVKHAIVLLDPGSEGVHALGVAGFPTTFVIGADQRMRGVLQGPAKWGDAAGALHDILS